MRTISPLYVYAGNTAIYQARMALLEPGDAAIVVSENSGPGRSVDPGLMQHIAELAARDITVLGYVHIDELGRTKTRTIDAVLDDIAAWHRLYGVTRLFMDEWPVDWTMRYIGAIWGAVRGYAGRGSVDKPILVVNPGVPLAIIRPPDGTLVVTNEDAYPSERTPQPWEASIVHSCLTPDTVRPYLAAKGWRWSYVTSDGSDGNPYDEVSE